MSQPDKFNSFTLGIFIAILCPIAALFGMIVCGIEQGARVPLHDAIADAAIYVIGFIVTASIGHIVAVRLLPAARSKLLAGRTWRFPVICGIAVSCAATLVEPTTDVLAGFFGHNNDNAVAAGGAIFWSAMATALVLGTDWLLCRLWREMGKHSTEDSQD